MIPLKLELENFLSYRQPAALDFGGIQLACISGENGAGKSSLLDAITWVLFGKCRAPGRDDIVNRQAARLGETARVQLDFELEGQIYRVLRLQKPGKTGVLELQLAVGDDWKSLTESTRTLTQSRLEELLRMNYETFTNASFLLQGRADEFTVKRPGERKRILGDLLGVSHWERYRDQAAQRRREADKEIAGVDARLAEIEAELEQKASRQERLKSAQAEHAAAQKQRDTQEQLVQSIQLYQAAVEQQKTLVHTLSNNLDQLERSQTRLLETQATRQTERKAFQKVREQAETIEADHAAWQAASAELKSWDSTAAEWNQLNNERQQALLQVERERSRLEQDQSQLLHRQQEAGEQRERRSSIQKQLEQTSAQLGALRQQLTEQETLRTSLGQIQSEMGAVKGDQPRLKQEMQKLKGRQVQLQAEEGGRCPLCDQELILEHRAAVIAQIEDEGTILGNHYREKHEKLASLQHELALIRDQLKHLEQVERELRQVERTETTARTQLNQVDQLLANWEQEGRPRLAAIKSQLSEDQIAPEAQKRITELEAAANALAYDSPAHADCRNKLEALGHAQKAQQRLNEARATLRSLNTTLEDLGRQITEQSSQFEKLEQQLHQANAQLDDLGPAPVDSLAAAERELNQLRETEVVANRAVGAAEQSLQALERQEQARGELQEQRQQTAYTIGQLKILERAFGRNGVQALLIEQALPAIQDSTNRLLDRLTGGEMRVTFSTQRQLKSRDALAETLDIHITDNAGERPYEMYSGGEAFRVNFAIRIALSRLLAQRAGARLQTLVIDEGFGSQDPEGRQRLIEAINSIRPDFAKILVITHIDELKDAFPVRIEVTKEATGSTIQIQ